MANNYVFGASGFLGYNIYKRLKQSQEETFCIDLKKPPTHNDADWCGADLRKLAPKSMQMNKRPDVIFQCAADVGGAGYIYSGKNDANILRNSILINASLLENILCSGEPYPTIFFASSAAVYPNNMGYAEGCAYPAMPACEYGWEKLLSERLYLAHAKNYGIKVRIARIHNIFGEHCNFRGDRATSIPAFCRMVAEAKDGDAVKIWGSGQELRSYLYIGDCVDCIFRLVKSDVQEPMNIGSNRLISTGSVMELLKEISGKDIKIVPSEGPQGVAIRNSNNAISKDKLGWEPDLSFDRFRSDLTKTYKWIEEQITKGL